MTFAVLLCDLWKLFSPDAVVKVLIRPIPIMPVTMAMPMVLSPKMLPFTIRKAPAKQRETPKEDSARCQVLGFLFNFYASLFISNFMLSIFNTKLDTYNITLFKSYYAKTKSKNASDLSGVKPLASVTIPQKPIKKSVFGRKIVCYCYSAVTNPEILKSLQIMPIKA